MTGFTKEMNFPRVPGIDVDNKSLKLCTNNIDNHMNFYWASNSIKDRICICLSSKQTLEVRDSLLEAYPLDKYPVKKRVFDDGEVIAKLRDQIEDFKDLIQVLKETLK